MGRTGSAEDSHLTAFFGTRLFFRDAAIRTRFGSGMCNCLLKSNENKIHEVSPLFHAFTNTDDSSLLRMD